MQIGSWQFKPRLLPSLATLVLFPLLLSLGFWQLDRAEQKRMLYEQSEKYRQQKPVELTQLVEKKTPQKDLFWRPVKAEGRFDVEKVILLDNQVHDGEAGYYVFTPLRLHASSVSVLVNRGWISAGGNRQTVPGFQTTRDDVMLTGIVKDVPSTGIFLGDNAVEKISDNIFRIQRVRIDEIEKILGYDLLPLILRLDAGSGHGFTREWPQPGSGEARHLGYAFQWFALAVTLLVIYVVVNSKKTV